MKTLAKSGSLTHTGVLLQALVAAALWLSPATAQQMVSNEPMGEDGLIVRIQSSDLVFIDRGSDHGISRGELFDIISSEMLVHPRTDSILAVTPKTVGALLILQVYPLTSLARLVQLDRGEDPMLKSISLVRDADRISEIEKQMLHGVRAAAGMEVPERIGIIPGLYQIRIGEKSKGWALLAVETLSLVSAIVYRANSDDWYDQYQNLQAGLLKSDYTFYFTKAQDRRTTSNRLFWLAGTLYLYNWVDIKMLGAASNLAYKSPQATGLTVGLGIDGSLPLLRLTHRF